MANQVPKMNSSSCPSTDKVLTLDNMNPHVKEMQYAVRGPIVARAGAIEAELKSGVEKPFTEVIRCNIGDCHAVGQTPITFIREVVALCAYPRLLNDPSFPDDAKNRAERVLESCKGHSVGAYSDSVGIAAVRHDIADYITKRDNGIPANFEDVFLSTGASDSIKSVLKLLMTGKEGTERAGIMIPIPQYPLYTATIAEYNAVPLGYYLNESLNWSLDANELERSYEAGRAISQPRAIVVINPGNPTGQVLTRDNIEMIIKFAHQRRLVILADEVYQHNVYAKGSKFYSFKKVLRELGKPYEDMELASFMSTSKGFMGECGFRSGYCEAINFHPDVKAMLMKSISAKLCSSVIGQAVMECVVNPPKEGEPSYNKFLTEKTRVLDELKLKAQLVTETFNSIDGVSCQTVQGAMYCFPRVELPENAHVAAKNDGKSPDAFYCFQLLEETGLCVVPGSGFGQKEGTFHFRMTILPPVDKIKATLETFRKFHKRFMDRFRSFN